jgi:hypothetical protein
MYSHRVTPSRAIPMPHLLFQEETASSCKFFVNGYFSTHIQQYVILNNNIFAMTFPSAIMNPLAVVHFKHGPGTGQVQDEIDVLFKHEYFPHPENVSAISFFLELTYSHLIATYDLVAPEGQEQQARQDRSPASQIFEGRSIAARRFNHNGYACGCRLRKVGLCWFGI